MYACDGSAMLKMSVANSQGKNGSFAHWKKAWENKNENLQIARLLHFRRMLERGKIAEQDHVNMQSEQSRLSMR
jgi:hypothetical protein